MHSQGEPVSQYTIRRADTSDLGALVAFAVQEASETEGVDPDVRAVRIGVQTGLEGSAPSTYWVAEAEAGRAVGSISVVTEWSNFRGGYYWWIQSLFIVPEHRGRGLVDQLLKFVAREASVAGALELRLYVLRSNERATAAYRRCGFETVPYAIMVRRLENL
jgi:ribosomal protein S18 acetylase RimI-like enzyme